jgi:hypothetical protein
MSKYLVGFTTSVLVEARNEAEAVEAARKRVAEHPQFLKKSYVSRDQRFIFSVEQSLGVHHV